ncbi:low temperature requirement protein A [Staphylococcus warneri]|uniref:low temperature requirement protein A n=1 Tax=Staphylococcus warneri TaxID=1292 RepID=UPI00254103F7|nr:low temperature requirement protein A [Staphylococcus warneri]MDK4212988.1 low temperature requirement protein A [Staphylococcus warneri]
METSYQPRHLQEKSAGFHELFFDLIFVYAMQKMAHVILNVHGGTISSELFLKYIIMSVFLWILWSHQTFYTNRFGETTTKDVIFMMFNLFVLVFLSNSLYPDFEKTFFPFFLCIGILYLSISIQYSLHLNKTKHKSDYKTCQAFAIVALIVAILSLVSLVLPKSIHYIPGFLGLFVASTGLIPYRKYLYQSPVNLSHLVERFSLLTIIIFGEVLVGLTSIFRIEHFNYIYIFQFLIVVSLFGTYWLVTESHINLHQTTIGFQLVYTHLLINIALGILNAAVIFSDSHQLSSKFEICMMHGSILLFYIGVWINTTYFHKELKNIKYIIIGAILLVLSFIISMFFNGYQDVMIISIAIANTLVMLLYYKNIKKRVKSVIK